MLTIKSVFVPAGTPSDEPVTEKVIVPYEVIVKISVFFPPGPSYTVKTALYYGEMQLWPHPEAEWLHGDNETIDDEPFLTLPRKDCELIIKACSPDALYNHTIVWRIHVLPPEYVFWWRVLMRVAKYAERFITLITRRR